MSSEGSVEEAADHAVAQLRQAGRELSASDEVLVALVTRTARVVDVAADAGEHDRMLRASSRLQQLLATLDPRVPTPAGGGDDDGSSDGDPPVGDRLERALRAGPTMGDAPAS